MLALHAALQSYASFFFTKIAPCFMFPCTSHHNPWWALMDHAQVAVQLRYGNEGLNQMPDELEDHGSDPVWEGQGDAEMLDVVHEPPVVAVVPAKRIETLGTQTISPLFLPVFLLGVPNHLMASDPLRHRWDLDWNTKDKGARDFRCPHRRLPIFPLHISHTPPAVHLAHANCTLFCASNAQTRTGSLGCKKSIFFRIFDERVFGHCEINCFFGIAQLHVPKWDTFLYFTVL